MLVCAYLKFCFYLCVKYRGRTLKRIRLLELLQLGIVCITEVLKYLCASEPHFFNFFTFVSCKSSDVGAPSLSSFRAFLVMSSKFGSQNNFSSANHNSRVSSYPTQQLSSSSSLSLSIRKPLSSVVPRLPTTFACPLVSKPSSACPSSSCPVRPSASPVRPSIQHPTIHPFCVCPTP